MTIKVSIGGLNGRGERSITVADGEAAIQAAYDAMIAKLDAKWKRRRGGTPLVRIECAAEPNKTRLPVWEQAYSIPPESFEAVLMELCP